MNGKLLLVIIIVAGLVAGALYVSNQQKMNEPQTIGEALDQTIEKTSEAVEDAGDAMEDAADDAADAIKDAADDAEDAADDAAESVEEHMEGDGHAH